MKRLFLLLVLVVLPSISQAEITQRDWALQLIDSLGWSFGLPEKPTDDDYAQMLGGRRIFRIEAEDSFQRTDRVSVMAFKTFGDFSGKGWLNGTKNPTQAHLKFNLPHAGRYKVRARVRLAEHHLIFGQRNFRMTGGQQFTDVEVGFVEFQAGPQEALLQLRPNGSIDYFELEAAPFEPIMPVGGWKFDEELTAEVAARTTIQALNLQAGLPATAQIITLEAENLVQPKGTKIYADRNKGDAGGGRYVQVGAAPVEIDFYTAGFNAEVADLVLRAAGTRPVKVSLPRHFVLQKRFDYRFDDRVLGTIFLPSGEMRVNVELPAGASLDRLELRLRKASRAAMLNLVGLEDTGQVSERDLNNLSALIFRLKALR